MIISILKNGLDKRVKNIPYKYKRQWRNIRGTFERGKMNEEVQNCGLSATTTTILVTRSLPLISLKLQVDWKVTTKVNPKSVSAAGNERDKFFPETWIEILTGFDSHWSFVLYIFQNSTSSFRTRKKNQREKERGKSDDLDDRPRCNLK